MKKTLVYPAGTRVHVGYAFGTVVDAMALHASQFTDKSVQRLLKKHQHDGMVVVHVDGTLVTSSSAFYPEEITVVAPKDNSL